LKITIFPADAEFEVKNILKERAMDKNIFRVGLIGYGRSGRDIHAWAIKQFGGRFVLAAISDVTESRRRQAAEENACPVYEDYRDMAEREDIDLFINTSFSNLHVPISIELIKQNKAVLCEKPLTNSLEEFGELETAVKQTGAFFTVFHNLRYEPVFVKLREMLASGIIGEPIQITMTANQFARRWDWQMSLAHGGGLLMVAGVHILDLALQLAGINYEPKVTSSLKHYGVGDADNYAKVLLTSDDGPTVEIECSYYDAFPRPRYHVQGTLGTISCTASGIEAKYYDPSDAPPVGLETAPLENSEGNPTFCKENLSMQTQSWGHLQNHFHVSFLAYYERLYRALTENAGIPVTLGELKQQVSILDACYRNAKL